MTNPDLVKCLEWLKATYPDDFDKLTGYTEKDGKAYYTYLEILSVNIVVGIVYFIYKKFNLAKGFVTIPFDNDNYINVSLYVGGNDHSEAHPETYEQFVEMFNQLINPK